MSDKINDGQLDHANKLIASLRESVAFMETLAAKRFDLLKAVASFYYGPDSDGEIVLRIPQKLLQAIEEETDEHEVEV